MSNLQIAIILTFWFFALIPLGAIFSIFVLQKMGLLVTPISEHHQGDFVKITSLLAMGAWVGLRSIFGALGAGTAVAGVWIGIVGFRWDHLALIGLSTPAVAIIVCTAMIVYFGWTLPQLNQARKSD